MVVIMNSDASQEDIENVIRAIEEQGLEAKVMEGARQKIVGVIGDKTKLAATPLDAMHGVETTVAISKSYTLASREFHPAPTVIDVRGDEEYAVGHIRGAVHIPGDQLAQRLDEVPANRPVVAY